METITTQAGVTLEPWSNGAGAIGFHCVGPRGHEQFIYLNPDPDETSPAVFLYDGPTGDPSQDDAITFCSIEVQYL